MKTAPAHNVPRLRVGLRLDALRGAELRREIDDCLAQGVRELCIDLADTEFTDSVGLAAVIYAQLSLDRVDGSVTVIRPRHEPAWRLFRLTRFDEVFAVSKGA